MRRLLIPIAFVLATGTARADEAPADFIGSAKLFYRVVSCGGAEALPATIDQAVVVKHCV